MYIVLFYRERDGLTLTKAGKELYDSIHKTIKDIEFAENENTIIVAKERV